MPTCQWRKNANNFSSTNLTREVRRLPFVNWESTLRRLFRGCSTHQRAVLPRRLSILLRKVWLLRELMGIAMNPIRLEAKEVLDAIRLRDEANRREILNRPGCSPCDPPKVDPTYFKTFELYEARKKAIPDPTTLIIVDEADRLQMNSLEQMRSIFDEGKAGMVLIGTPGIEKRIARFPQLYSRIGFVHEFRALDSVEMQKLPEQRWTPVGVKLPNEQLPPEAIA